MKRALFICSSAVQLASLVVFSVPCAICFFLDCIHGLSFGFALYAGDDDECSNPPPRTDMMNLVDDDYLVERNDGFYSLNS